MNQYGRPSYRFNFFHGLSTKGEVERVSETIGGERAHRVGYELDDLALTISLGCKMPSEVADLIDFSAAVYIADRLSLRQVDGDLRLPQDRWHRRIHVAVPLRHPDPWRQSDVIACMERLLGFLTDDIWTFEFTQRSELPRPAQSQIPFLQRVEGEVAVTLQSGGLDSLFGLAHLLTHGPGSVIVPVTVATSDRVRCTAGSVIEEIRKPLATSVRQLLPTQIHIRVGGVGRPRDDREATQRARGLLFLLSGLGAAATAGADHLWVCENGIGAISLRMTVDHWGARATRAMHPVALLLASRLATIVLGRAVIIENLGLFFTKGQLAEHWGHGQFHAAACQTVSCDHMSYMRSGAVCGKCTSCILRRIALVAANLGEIVDRRGVNYRTDWFDSEASWRSKDIIHLMAMRDQVERLREATKDGRGFAALESAFPDLFDIVALAPILGLTKDDVEQRLLNLYETHLREFDTFVARIDRPGWGRATEIAKLVVSDREVATG